VSLKTAGSDVIFRDDCNIGPEHNLIVDSAALTVTMHRESDKISLVLQDNRW